MKLSKQNLSSLPILILSTFLVMCGASILTSCGGKKHSVRQMRDAKAPYIPRPQERAMIQPLFLQHKKANIGLPPNVLSGGAGGGSIAREQVTYTNANNYTDLFNEKLDLGKAYDIDEVVVEARSTFTPERDGKIDVDFVVRVPRELIDRNWMMTMQPFIMHTDSLQKLDHIVIKGEQFALKQKLDYQAYEDYLNSIVPKEDYDSVFLNHDLINQDIKARQEFYYQEYHKDWALHKEYEDWIAEQKDKVADEKALLKGDLAELKYDYMRKLLTHSVRDIARGIDTTGLAASYNAEYLRKASGIQKKLDRMELEEIKIPKKYKEVHAMRTGSKDVENLSMTSQDTLDIAKNRYMFDAIIDNEMKEARKEIVKKEMIRFPYDEKARLDSTVQIGQDFAYYYKQSLPVRPGMRSVNIAMETQVVAIDESKFNMRRSDTLAYFISSIAQLVDTSLLHKETVRNRNLSHRQTAYLQFRPNTWRFDANYKNNAAELAKIAKDYDTFQSSRGFAVDSIFMQLGMSLDGEFNRNADLAMSRVADLKKYFVASTPMGKQLTADNIRTNYLGEDWNGLVRLLRSNKQITNRDAIIDILGNAYDADKAKKEAETKFPEDFKLMKDSLYPKLEKVEFLFYVHRKDMIEDTEVITVEPEQVRGVRLLQNREYEKALEILINYQDYNFAVCLAALGYNGQAYEVLTKQKATNGNIEYLSAILAWRLGQESVAIEHLMKAIKLDDTKIYRMDLDSDIKEMVEKHKLQNRINQIHN